ncbi:MAG: hypothetical protein ACOC93_01235, partial [Planctomycetota bacterium]
HYHPLVGDRLQRAPEPLDFPTAEGVWTVGRRLAREGKFTDPLKLLPVYTRKPEAVRLWELGRGK